MSRVQARACEFLMFADARDKAQNFFDDLRSRLAAVQPDRLHTIFPEWAPEPAAEDALDSPDTRWTTPASESERMDLEQWLRQNAVGVASGGDLGAGEWT